LAIINLKIKKIMAQKATSAIPQGMHTITPSLWFNGNCRKAIDFYQKTFQAELIGQIFPTPDGTGVWHAMMKIGNSTIMMADAQTGGWERGPEKNTTMSLWLYVDDCDLLFNNSVKNGCEIKIPLMDAFWGDRMGQVKDQFGHCWTIATYKWIYTPEEMQQKQEEMLAQAEH
jgi:uncharacterized glyoxalase superfamily protein PhnB